MNTTHNIRTKRLAAVLGAAAVAVVPAVLLAGAGTAHAFDPACDDGGLLQGSYYCSPYSQHWQPPEDSGYTPVQPPFGMNNLPGCSGGALAGIIGVLNGQGCS